MFLITRLVVIFLAIVLGLGPSFAGTIDNPPDPGIGYVVNVAENFYVPGHPSAQHTGIAQSFTAEDPRVQFGFYFAAAQLQQDEALQYSLYAGDGLSGPLLAQGTTIYSFPGDSAEVRLLTVDFSSVALNPGQSYTVAASSPGFATPPPNTALETYARFTYFDRDEILGTDYAGGQFYYTGTASQETWNSDIAFKVTPVPEPSSLAMGAAGIGLLGLWIGRRGTRAGRFTSPP